MKSCTDCRERLPHSCFYVSKRSGNGNTVYSARCKKCHSAKASARNAAKPTAYWQATNLRYKYAMTLQDWDALRTNQNGLCAICASTLPLAPCRAVHVDHDHKTGVVRGLLCAPCNRGLGQFKDSAAIVAAAVKYLEGVKIE